MSIHISGATHTYILTILPQLKNKLQIIFHVEHTFSEFQYKINICFKNKHRKINEILKR